MGKAYLLEHYEDVPGYEGAVVVPSVKELFSPATSFEATPEPAPLERDDEFRGIDEPLEVSEDEHNPKWSYASRAYPDLVGFRLKHALGPPTSTPGDGKITDPDGAPIPTNCHRHVWEAPYGPSGPNPLTTDAVVAYVDENTFVHVTGCGCEEVALASGEAGGIRLTASGSALVYDPIADPAEVAAPESLAVLPFMRSEMKVVTWEGDERNIENLDVTITNPIEVARSLAAESRFPDLMEKAEGPIVVSFSVPKRHLSSAELEFLLAATRFAVKVRWASRSTIAATAYPYRLWLEGEGAQYTGGGPDALENKRRIGATYQGKLTSDGVGASSKFTLVNATASYA
jgi:hypothetical protein